MTPLDDPVQPFERAHLRIVARQNARRLQEIRQQVADQRQQAVGALRKRLHHQHVTVAVDDETRQPVALAVDQPIRRRVNRQRLAIADGRVEPLAPERRVGPGVAPRQHPEGNHRATAVKRVTERPAVRADHLHDIARGGPYAPEIRPVDPRMPGPQATLPARGHRDRGFPRGLPRGGRTARGGRRRLRRLGFARTVANASSFVQTPSPRSRRTGRAPARRRCEPSGWTKSV